MLHQLEALIGIKHVSLCIDGPAKDRTLVVIGTFKSVPNLIQPMFQVSAGTFTVTLCMNDISKVEPETNTIILK